MKLLYFHRRNSKDLFHLVLCGRFWDVMCSACGTQNGSEKSPSRVFSVRRNINSWSDVVHLIINCLKVKNMGQQYFDFESQILPFLDANIDKLHLPRQVFNAWSSLYPA